MRPHLFIAVFFLLVAPDVCVRAQQIDLYNRLTDPRAIARLSGVDALPLRQSSGFGTSGVIDSTDHFILLAHDSGAGIITHIWFAGGIVDSISEWHLYIDDTLAVSCHPFEFFSLDAGALRAPFDSTYPGGNVCDVQMPFRKGFKITISPSSNNYYYAIVWRPVTDPWLVEPFRLNPTYPNLYKQQLGEARFRNTSSPWKSDSATEIEFDGGIRGNDTLELASIKGPGMIQTIHIQPDTYDRMTLDSIRFQLFWDGSDQSAVDIPMNDFFGAGTGAWKNTSYFFRVDASQGYTCYFPMPFHTRAVIRLVNSGSRTVALKGFIRFDSEAIDPKVYGYFGAQFNESNPTRYHVFHPVLHRLGRGRYVGMNWSVPNPPSPMMLEGDPFINVDSSPSNMLHYTGGEDYLNGGWWFKGAVFTAPFSGFTHIFDSFYRFHILDAIDYAYSIDYLLQHGVANDISDDYRTVAYYYELPTSFWPDRDTIRHGETWTLKGSGYAPNAPIQAGIGTVELFTSSADSAGAFEMVLPVPAKIIDGASKIWVNNVTRPEPIYVLSHPSIRLISDSLPVTVRYGDTILVHGAGFDRGEKVTLSLDSIPVTTSSEIVVGADHSFFATIEVPYLPDWRYHIVAHGERSGNAECEQPINLVRYLDLEFEDLVPGASIGTGTLVAQNVSYYWQAKWSKQAFALYEPVTSTGFAGFKFYIPHQDTFDVTLLATVGANYGRYLITIDGKEAATFDGYRRIDWADPLPSDSIKAGVWFLTRDTHYVQWTCVGRADSAKNYWLGADNIVLKPTTKLPLAPGTFLPTKLPVPLEQPNQTSLAIFPNPASENNVVVRLGLNDPKTGIGGIATVSLFDLLGRVVRRENTGQITSPEISQTISTSGLPQGSYIVQIEFRNGSYSLIEHGILRILR